MMGNLSLKPQNQPSIEPLQFNRRKEIPQTIPEVNEEQKYGINSPQYEPPQFNFGGNNSNMGLYNQAHEMTLNNQNPFNFGMMGEPNFFAQHPPQFPQNMDYMLGMGMASKYGMGGMGNMNAMPGIGGMNNLNNLNNMGMYMQSQSQRGFGGFQNPPPQYQPDPYSQFTQMYGQQFPSQNNNNRMNPQQFQMKNKNNAFPGGYMNNSNNKQYGQNKKMNNKNFQRNKGSNMMQSQNNNMLQNRPMNPYMMKALENPTFDDVYAGIPDICKDHAGSKVFQKIFEEESNPLQKQKIIEKLLPEVYNLSKDVFGNYVIQHLLDIVSTENKKKIILELYNKIKELTLHMYGCRVIQKGIEVGDIEDIREHLLELKDELIKCVQDQNGNHVIQKLIEKLPKGEHGEIIKAVKGKVFQLSTHQYGCRAIQRIFEYCTDQEKNAVIKEIFPNVNELCIDQYGNYVIQNIIEKIKNNQIIYDCIKGKIYEYSIHKFASNVIETCLALGTKDQIALIVTEIIEQDNKNSDVLLSLVRDKFGNYVVQKMIEVGDMKSKEILVKKIVSSQVLKKRDGFSKHVISMIEKLGLTQLLEPANLQNQNDFIPSSMGNNGNNVINNFYKSNKAK